MSAKSAFSILGLAHKLCLVAEAQGYTPELLNDLRQRPKLLFELLKVQRGEAEIKPIHIIDCDADPYLPSQNFGVERHQKGGLFKWDLAHIELSFPVKQSGNDLYEELKDKLTLNACVLDYLLANPHLIPISWKTKRVFFWGTIYRGPGGYLCVRCLFWTGSRWEWGWSFLSAKWDNESCPAALRVIPTESESQQEKSPFNSM